MKKFLGKIGLYGKMNQRQRSAAYLKRERDQHKMNVAHSKYIEEQKRAKL